MWNAEERLREERTGVARGKIKCGKMVEIDSRVRAVVMLELRVVTVTTSQALRIIECVYTVSQGRGGVICAVRISCLRENTDGVTYMVP